MKRSLARRAVIVSLATVLTGIPVGAAVASHAGPPALTVNPNQVVAGTSNNFQLTYTAGAGGGVKCIVYTLTGFSGLSGPVVVAPHSGWSADLGPDADQVTIAGNPAVGNGLSGTVTVDATSPGGTGPYTWTGHSYTDTDCTKSVGSATDVVTVNPASTGGGPGTPCHCRPDMLIRLSGHPRWKGNNVYSGTGHNESIKVAAHAGQTWTVFLRGENDGTRPDDITISGAQSRPFIKVHYFHGFTNITKQVIGHVYIQNLAPGERTLLRMVVHLRAGVRPGVTRVFPVEGRSGLDESRRDVVKFKTNIFRR